MAREQPTSSAIWVIVCSPPSRECATAGDGGVADLAGRVALVAGARHRVVPHRVTLSPGTDTLAAIAARIAADASAEMISPSVGLRGVPAYNHALVAQNCWSAILHRIPRAVADVAAASAGPVRVVVQGVEPQPVPAGKLRSRGRTARP